MHFPTELHGEKFRGSIGIHKTKHGESWMTLNKNGGKIKKQMLNIILLELNN